MVNFNVAHTANPELRKMPFGIKVLHFLKENAVRTTLLLFIELFRHFSSG
jgi:hypothetical protein